MRGHNRHSASQFSVGFVMWSTTRLGYGLVHSFELEPKLFLHCGEDRRPAFGIVRRPCAAKLKRVIVGAGKPGLVNDGLFYHRTQGTGDGPHWGIRSDELEAVLRSMRLDVGGWGRGGRFAVRRRGTTCILTPLLPTTRL
jgi:hypothetical protein